MPTSDNATMIDNSTMTDNPTMIEKNANDLCDRSTRIQINTTVSEIYSNNVTNGGILITSVCILWCVVLYCKLFVL